MDVEVYLTDSPPIAGHPVHSGKYLVVKMPSVVKGGNYFAFDKARRQVAIVNYGVTYFVDDVPADFELGEESLRKVNEVVKNAYPDDILKQIKIINKQNNGDIL